ALRVLARHHQKIADDAGPAIIDEIDFLNAAGDKRIEIIHALLLPAGLKALHPLQIGRSVVAQLDGRRRALEDIEFLCPFAEMRHTLHGRCARADDADALVLQPFKAAIAVATRVAIIPPAGVKRMAFETFNAGNAGQLRAMQRAAGRDNEAGADGVPPVGVNDPAGGIVIPAHLRHFGLEERIIIKAEMAADGTAVLENLGGLRVFLDRHVADFLEKRQIDIGFNIAGGTGIAVPVPCAAEITALLNQADPLYACFTQAGTGKQAAKAAADNHDIDFI